MFKKFNPIKQWLENNGFFFIASNILFWVGLYISSLDIWGDVIDNFNLSEPRELVLVGLSFFPAVLGILTVVVFSFVLYRVYFFRDSNSVADHISMVFHDVAESMRSYLSGNRDFEDFAVKTTESAIKSFIEKYGDKENPPAINFTLKLKMGSSHDSMIEHIASSVNGKERSKDGVKSCDHYIWDLVSADDTKHYFIEDIEKLGKENLGNKKIKTFCEKAREHGYNSTFVLPVVIELNTKVKKKSINSTHVRIGFIGFDCVNGSIFKNLIKTEKKEKSGKNVRRDGRIELFYGVVDLIAAAIQHEGTLIDITDFYSSKNMKSAEKTVLDLYPELSDSKSTGPQGEE